MYILFRSEMAFSKATIAGSVVGVNRAALELDRASGRRTSVCVHVGSVCGGQSASVWGVCMCGQSTSVWGVCVCVGEGGDTHNNKQVNIGA